MDVDTYQDSMGTNQDPVVGVVYDPLLEKVRPWSPGVNETIQSSDGELANSEVPNPSVDMNQGPVPGHVSDHHHVEGTVGETGHSDYLPAAGHSPSHADCHSPDLLDGLDPNSLSPCDSARPTTVEKKPNIAGSMAKQIVRLSSENHWAGGWESLPPGDLPGPGAQSVYDTQYWAPVDCVDPQLTVLTRDTPVNMSVNNAGPLNFKACQCCLIMRDCDLVHYKYCIPDKVSRSPWIEAAISFCLTSDSVCPTCQTWPVRTDIDSTTLMPFPKSPAQRIDQFCFFPFYLFSFIPMY